MKKFQELKELVNTIESDAVKFYDNGNKAAGTRVRIGLQAIKTKAQEIRKEIVERKK